MKDFKELRGNRILVTRPIREKSKVLMDKATEAALDAEHLQNFNRLEVYAVGNLVTDINVGDEILVDLSLLNNKPVIHIIGGKQRILLSIFDIILVW